MIDYKLDVKRLFVCLGFNPVSPQLHVQTGGWKNAFLWVSSHTTKNETKYGQKDNGMLNCFC